jgi:hypothetical protein
MSWLYTQALHVLAAFGLFSALGTLLLGRPDAWPKSAAILHGLSWLLLLLVGFALLRKPPMDEYWWMAKLAIWVLLGVAPLLVRRRIAPPLAVLVGCLLLGGFATLLGLAKSAIF